MITDDISAFLTNTAGFAASEDGKRFERRIRVQDQMVIVNGRQLNNSREIVFIIKYIGDGEETSQDGVISPLAGYKIEINGHDQGDVWCHNEEDMRFWLSQIANK